MRIFEATERLRESLDYHLERHNLLASNLAQLETPGFHPLDLARAEGPGAEGERAPGEAFHATLARTEAGHLGGTADAGGTSGVGRVIEDASVPAGGDGNSVSLDREAVKIAANNLRYDAIASMTAGQLSSLVWAANDGRSG